MGRHFDALVEFAGRHIAKDELSTYHIPDVKKYLEDIVRKAVLFEFPLLAQDIFPKSGKNNDEYSRYLHDYFVMSQQYGSFFITPFPLTAVEDSVSVVIMDNLDSGKYLITICISDVAELDDQRFNTSVVCCGYAELEPPVSGALVRGIASPQFVGTACKNERVHLAKGGFEGAQQDLQTAMASYIEQVVYIMDPENFIFRKESRESRKFNNTKRKKKNKVLQKTVLRPHYIILSEKDTSAFLRNKSKHPRPAHPVRGHWKKLRSEKYVNKRGQRIYIKQYFTGKGEIEAEGGWNYEVMIKESPTKIVAYNR